MQESPGKGEGHNAHTLPGSVGTISAIFQGWRKVPESQLPPYRVFLFPLIQPSYDDDVTQMEQPRSPGNSPCSRWGLAEEALFPLAPALSQCWMVELWLSGNKPNSLTFKIFFPRRWKTQLVFVLHKDYSHFPSSACSFRLCTVLSPQLPHHRLFLLYIFEDLP